TRTRTAPGPGAGTVRSTNSKAPFGPETCMTRMAVLLSTGLAAPERTRNRALQPMIGSRGRRRERAGSPPLVADGRATPGLFASPHPAAVPLDEGPGGPIPTVR